MVRLNLPVCFRLRYVAGVFLCLGEGRQVPRRGENIYKRKDGRWEGRYKKPEIVAGKYTYASVYGKSYTEVKEKLLRKREENRSRQQQKCMMTLGQLMDLWLKDRESRVKASSFARYRALAEKHIRPLLGDVPVRNLTAENMESFISGKVNQGKLRGKGGLAPKTISDVLFVVRSVLKYGKLWHGFLDTNRILDVAAPKVPKYKVETFGEQETKELSRCLEKNWNRASAMMLLSLNAGLRLGELCGLKWSDLNEKECELAVNRTVQRTWLLRGTSLQIQLPKSDAALRTIPLSKALMKRILSLRSDDSPECYILSGTLRPMDPRSLQYRFATVLKHCSIRKRNFHVLRHSFATRCIERGMDVKCLSEILGHANIKTTLQLYVHPSRAQKRVSMERVSTLSA